MESKNSKSWQFGIRNRILAFTVLVTLAPTLGLGVSFYSQMKQLLQEKIEQELHNTTTQAHREVVLWFKENNFNLKVFSNSFIITENLEQVLATKKLNGKNSPQQKTAAMEKITDYLTLVQSKFHEHKRLLLLDSSGKIVAQSPTTKNDFTLPGDWQKQLKKNKMVLGEIGNSRQPEEPFLLMAVPVLSNKQKFIGILATELGKKGLESILNSSSLSEFTQLLLIKKDGSTVIKTGSQDKMDQTPHIDGSHLGNLLDNPMKLSIYTNTHGSKVIGVFAQLPYLSWGIVMEKSYKQAFIDIDSMKHLTIAVIIVLLLFCGIVAFLVSRSILSPLDRLISGAQQVSTGDLSVELPTKNRDELEFAISVFNDMVVRLRKNHEELEYLSTVDSLTGLFNRKRLMEMLSLQIKRYHRNKTPFSILLGDLDHFKQINDQHGHLAGDAVLVMIGEIFSKILRSPESAGRYGGEEFLILLDDTQEQGALRAAERIRKAVEESSITVEGKKINVTISIGVAIISENINTEEKLFAAADKALYEAKQGGRNRVVLSSTPDEISPEPINPSEQHA